jgi:hypothetical protein
MCYMLHLPDISLVIKLRRLRWARYVASMGERIGEYTVLVRNPEGKRQLGGPWRR